MGDLTGIALSCLGGAAVGAVAGAPVGGVGAVPGAIGGCIGGLILTSSTGCAGASTRTPEQDTCMDTGLDDPSGNGLITETASPEVLNACADGYVQVCDEGREMIGYSLFCGPLNDEGVSLNPDQVAAGVEPACIITYPSIAPNQVAGLQVPFGICHKICNFNVYRRFAADNPFNPRPGEEYVCETEVETIHGAIWGAETICGISVSDTWEGSWPDYCAE